MTIYKLHENDLRHRPEFSLNHGDLFVCPYCQNYFSRDKYDMLAHMRKCKIECDRYKKFFISKGEQYKLTDF